MSNSSNELLLSVASYWEMSMNKIEYFDYQKAAREMKMSTAIFKKIAKEVRAEFPNDKMIP